MIWGAIRVGRMVARGSVQRGPKPPAKEWPLLGKLIFAGIVISVWWAMNWHSLVIVAGVLLGITLILGLAGAGRPRAPRAYERDPLDDLMDDYARKEGKP